MDALLAAYRVGPGSPGGSCPPTAVDAGLPAETVAEFAELVFAYIDELSAASVAGHTDELATTGRARQRYLERLGQHSARRRPGGRADRRAPSGPTGRRRRR